MGDFNFSINLCYFSFILNGKLESLLLLPEKLKKILGENLGHFCIMERFPALLSGAGMAESADV